MFSYPLVQMSLCHADVGDGYVTKRTTKFIYDGCRHAFRESILEPEKGAESEGVAENEVEVDVRVGFREEMRKFGF